MRINQTRKFAKNILLVAIVPYLLVVLCQLEHFPPPNKTSFFYLKDKGHHEHAGHHEDTEHHSHSNMQECCTSIMDGEELEFTIPKDVSAPPILSLLLGIIVSSIFLHKRKEGFLFKKLPLILPLTTLIQQKILLRL